MLAITFPLLRRPVLPRERRHGAGECSAGVSKRDSGRTFYSFPHCPDSLGANSSRLALALLWWKQVEPVDALCHPLAGAS